MDAIWSYASFSLLVSENRKGTLSPNRKLSSKPAEQEECLLWEMLYHLLDLNLPFLLEGSAHALHSCLVPLGRSPHLDQFTHLEKLDRRKFKKSAKVTMLVRGNSYVEVC